MPGLNGPDAAQKISSLQTRIQTVESNLPDLVARREELLAKIRQFPAVAAQLPSDAPPSEVNPPSDENTSKAVEAAPVVDEKQILAIAKKINDEHIRKLHEYNEIRDVGMGLMGMIAEQRGARIAEVQKEFGIDSSD